MAGRHSGRAFLVIPGTGESRLGRSQVVVDALVGSLARGRRSQSSQSALPEGGQMRIAWVGLSPTDDVGTSYLATQLLVELSRLGVDCEVFCAAAETSIHPRVRASEDLRLFCLPSGWEPDRWYNRTPQMS